MDVISLIYDGREGPSRSEPDAMAMKRWCDAMLKNAMAMKRCYDAMLKNAMAMKRCYDAMELCYDAMRFLTIASYHRFITSSPSRFGFNAQEIMGI